MTLELRRCQFNLCPVNILHIMSFSRARPALSLSLCLSVCWSFAAIADTRENPAAASSGTDPVGVPTAVVTEATSHEVAFAVDPETIISNEIAAIELLVSQGQDVDALVRIHQALLPDPDNIRLLHINGGIQRKLQDHAGAIITYERIVRLAPEDAVAAALLALILQEIARTVSDAEALDFLAHALELVEIAPGITLDYVSVASKNGKHRLATEAYERLRPQLQKIPDTMRVAAASYAAVQAMDQAIELYGELVEMDPRDAPSARRLVELLRENDRGTEAIEKLSAALKADPDNVVLLLLKSEISADEGAVWSELRSLVRITRLRPGNREAVNRQVDRLLGVGCIGLASQIADRHAAVLSTELRARASSLMRAREAEWKAIDATLPDPRSESAYKPVFLAYGDVRWSSSGTADILDVPSLINQIEYLRAHDYRFVGAIDISAQQRGKRNLPDRSVMLMFNNGYASFAKNVLPLLEIYGIPAVVSLPSLWISSPKTSKLRGELMNWETIASIASHPQVTLASMTHSLASHVRVNPQGRLALASVSRRHDPRSGKYESAAEHRAKVEVDLRNSIATIRRKTGNQVDILVWPEGAYNAVTLAEALRTDFMLMFALRAEPGHGPDRRVMPQRPVPGDISLGDFAYRVRSWAQDSAPPRATARAMPLNLDSVAIGTPEDIRKNVADALARVAKAGVNTVYLRAYADPRGSGNAEAVYFPNRILPVKADLLSHVTALLRYRGIRVFVSMPALSVTPPDIARDNRFFVMEYRWGRIQPMSEWNRRLSPFHPRTRKIMTSLYEDLAANIECDGYLIENDAYLSDSEDFSPAASELYRDELDIRERNPEVFKPDELKRWTDRKSKQLDMHLAALRKVIHRARPSALIGRTIHAATLWDPGTDKWLAQNYAQALKNNDFVVIPVSPESYQAENSQAWITDICQWANKHATGLDKTVFSIEVLNTDTQHWLSRRFWKRRTQALMQGGAVHVSYFPDRGALADLPKIADVHEIMSGIAPRGASIR